MTTLVIGAGKGIGYQVVVEYLKCYPQNNLIAISKNIENLKLLKENSNSLTVIKCDITSEQSLRKLNRYFESKKLKIDNIINLAAVLVKKDWKKLTIKDFNSVFHTNVYAPFNLIRILSKHFSKNKKGHIVNISSMGGVEGTQKFPGMAYYSSSKAALNCLTECLAVELKNTGFHVNCIALGTVETEMKHKAFPEFIAPHSPKDIAPFLVRFLIQDQNLFNGKTIKLSISNP